MSVVYELMGGGKILPAFPVNCLYVLNAAVKSELSEAQPIFNEGAQLCLCSEIGNTM
jgi:hypothetical protein